MTGNEDETSTSQPVNVGQWSTAELGDTQRQNKFFQLLGGFKKSSGSNSTVLSSTANSALNKAKESALNTRLEKQFENARHTHLNAKGFGLGFSQPKANSIDIYSSKSVKFDD